jgi:hypothetical protein
MKPVKTEGNEGETRGGAYVMEMDVPIFKGCGKLLAGAKQVISNWEHGDLAAAVRNLDLSIKEIQGLVPEDRRDVILLVIEFPNGRNFLACEDGGRALDELYEFVEEYWHEMPADLGEILSDKLKAIELYYKEKEGKESVRRVARLSLTD